MEKISFYVFASLAILCVGETLPPQIINGNDAAINAWPWQASLRRISVGIHFCGGSLINTRWILTAKHCSDNKQSSEVEVVLGAHYLLSDIPGQQEILVEKIINHPNYTGHPTYLHDIALWRLKKPAIIDPGRVEFINIPWSGEQIDDNQNAVITGWGLHDMINMYNKKEATLCGVTKTQAEVISMKYFQRVTCGLLVRVCTDNNACNSINDIYLGLMPATLNEAYVGVLKKSCPDSLVCVGTTKFGSCSGDSGGPLVQKYNGAWMLFGVTSHGNAGCILRDGSSRYTKISYYRDWISRNML